MPSVESETQAGRRQLELVLASPGFARNKRLSRFLRFVVEGHLEGRDAELKESLIAIEVFGRLPGHDSKKDPIVRTEASRLRARLSEYYSGEGKGDSLKIELPKGGYVPVFRPNLAELPPTTDSSKEGSPAPSRRSIVPPPRTAAIAAGIACIVMGMVAAGWWWFRRNEPIRIEVLQLQNVGGDPTNDYFAEGLTDELIRQLSIIDGLSPRSRSSSFLSKERPRNLREVGKELVVDYVLEGSVQRMGQQLRIKVRLVRVRDDFPIWSGEFDRGLKEVFAVEDEISRGIVNSLRQKLGRGRRRYETSAEAYDLYLRARAFEIQGNVGDYPPSIGLYEQAIGKDPSFAPAYAGLAATYAYTSATFPNSDRRDDQLAKMRTAAAKAIELDPLLAEAYDALGTAYARDGHWEESEKSFRSAIQLDHNRSTSYCDFARHLLFVLGRTDEALRQLQAAEKTDPLSPEVHRYMAYGLTSLGRYDEAAGHCEKLTGHTASECMGRARLGQGRIGEAIQVLAIVGNRGYLGYAYARAGRHEEAEKVAAEVSPNPFNEALVYAGLGDKNRTLDALERMAALGPVRIGLTLSSPEFAFVRGDPRANALREKVGLPHPKS
jgi:TolB-like protein